MNRLGQGGGYYDRAFARYPDALRIGLAWSVQEHDALPADPWDLPLHIILTEVELIEGPDA
jgi:5-formyltetrahydrofolate cyclo-ligase